MRGDRVILADDHPLFREGIRRLLQRVVPQAEIIEADDLVQMLQLARRGEPPSTFIIDLIFAGKSVEPDLPALRREFPRSSIIFVSMVQDRAIAERIMGKGADGFICKSLRPLQIMAGIAAVRDGERIILIEPDAKDMPEPKDDLSALTFRQREVLRLLSAGRTNKEIGQALHISPYTVRAHVSALLKTLGVSSRTAAVSKAKSSGLI
ncbi:response regulator transcription factor [Mesorhizobium sp. Pch-S]|uniref:response regulator transcription factor n=2 Tax=Mesorhizobium TaxID=68287 RepID=UPI001FE07AAA|nr:response regulator transcription factor [Mesorhizobium sp. Pch-S]